MKLGTYGWIGCCHTVATAAALSLLPGAAAGQQETGADAPVEEIVVTGSRLARRDLTAPSPITTIDRDAIVDSGQPTLEESLNRLPQVQPGFGRASNNPGNGTAQVDLRGVGPGRTLVMLNGRRIAPAGIGSAVDVNTLPGVLIERVEVITGGATTVYGSDAVAGVVNFITREDFDGFGLETSYYTTAESDSDIFDISVAWGHDFGRGNVTVYGTYLDREPTFQAERVFSSQTINDNWLTGMLEPGGSTTTPAGAIAFPRVDFGNGPARTTWDANGDPREFIVPDDRYDFAPINYLQVPLERYSAGVLLNVDIGAAAELYTELMYTNNQSTSNLAPAAAFGRPVAVNTDNPVLTTANREFLADNMIPLGGNLVGFALQRRLEELGPRIIRGDKDYARLLAGIRGDFAGSWGYDVWASYTQGEETEENLNDGSYSRLTQGLLVDPASGECFDPSGGCVPLDLFGEGNLSQAGADFVRAPPYVSAVEREQLLVSAFVRGAPLALPAGDLAVAIGAEWREDSGSFVADEALFSEDALGFRAFSNIDGEESVAEIYAEALVPILNDLPLARYLGLEVGGRLSDYDNAGELETWKLGADWEPFDGVRFRTMFQRSARAPNLEEAFLIPFEENGTVVSFDTREDPCSASADPVANGLADVCIAQGIPAGEIGVYEAALGSPVVFTFGGNPDLTPEIAETFTAGIVLTAFDAWTLSVDYFEIDVEDTIGESRPMSVCWDPGNTDRVTCDRIGRDPVTYYIDAIDATAANLGKLRTEGFDTQLTFDTELSGLLALGAGYADLNVRVIWTHVDENSVQGDPAATPLECVGKFGAGCAFVDRQGAFPENRVTTNVTWSTEDWHAWLGWRWIEGTDNSAADAAPFFGLPPDLVNPAIASIGSKSFFDLSLRHYLNENLNLTLTVSNLLDEDPAFMAFNGPQANTDTQLYDVFGRAYTLRLALTY